MTNLASSDFAPATNKPLRALELREQPGEGQVGRAFMIYLVTQEIQLCPHVARWLRTTAQRLEAEQRDELAAECLRMSAETWELREQLIALALRLVARRNRLCSHNRINAMQLVEQTTSSSMRRFLELNEQTVSGAEAGVEIEIIATIEELLTRAIPLAIEVAGLDDNGDLYEAAEFYLKRSPRAAKLRALVDTLLELEPEREQLLRAVSTQALDNFNFIARESAELGQRLDHDSHSMC